MVTLLECPVCSETTEDNECPACGCDLSVLIETRRAAFRLARGAHELARKRRIHEAANSAERGMQLFLDEELRKLFGWLLFLDGRFRLATWCWESIPDQARSLIRSYNAALAAARRGALREALDELADVQLPFRPATRLEWMCAELERDSSRKEEARSTLATAFPDAIRPFEPRRAASAPEPTQEPSRVGAWRPAPLAAAGLVLLLVGAVLGFLLQQPPQGTTPGAETSELATASSTRATTPEDAAPSAPVADSLRYGWAFLNRDPGPVVEVSGARVPSQPINEVRHIPARTREVIARDWYLEGLAKLEADSAREARMSLRAALASVGSTSALYWVDDALYLLMRVTAESDRRLAMAAAEAILANHPNSMYVNSITRAVASETR